MMEGDYYFNFNIYKHMKKHLVTEAEVQAFFCLGIISLTNVKTQNCDEFPFCLSTAAENYDSFSTSEAGYVSWYLSARLMDTLCMFGVDYGFFLSPVDPTVTGKSDSVHYFGLLQL
jgi:hypothetical protein